MMFSELCNVLDRLDSNPGHLVSIDLISDVLKDLEEEEIPPAIRLILNEPAPIWNPDYSPLDPRMVIDVAIEKSGLSRRDFLRLVVENNDLSSAIEIALMKQEESHRNKRMNMSVTEVYSLVRELSNGSARKSSCFLDQMRETFDVLRPNEVKHLLKSLIFEGRFRSSEGILEESISTLSAIELSEVRRKNAIVSDVALVGKVALRKGREDFCKLSLEIFRPIKPMTAVVAQSLEEASKEYGELVSYEFKPDGIRVQIHKRGDRVRFFDRKLKDISPLLPDLARNIIDNIQEESTVLEGEVVAKDTRERLGPYSALMGELRSREMNRASTPKTHIDLELFDVLILDGRDMMSMTYNNRRGILSKISGETQVTSQIQIDDLDEAHSFYTEAIKHGYEGLVAKHPYSIYVPGIRTRYWAKIRESPNNLDLVIMSIFSPSEDKMKHETYLLGSNDLRTGQFVPVAKCCEGLSEDERNWLSMKLEEVTLEKTSEGSIVLPRIVLEVSFRSVKRNTSMPGGYWLESPVATRVRIDKSPKEIDSLQWVEKLAGET